MSALTIAAALPLAGHAVERSEVPEQLRWDLGDLYADEGAWLADKSAFAAELPRLAAWRDRLKESSQVLAQAIAAREAATRRADRLYAYALQLYDQDTRVARSMQMKQEAQQMLTDLQTVRAGRADPRRRDDARRGRAEHPLGVHVRGAAVPGNHARER
jgi:hypothetical protein